MFAACWLVLAQLLTLSTGFLGTSESASLLRPLPSLGTRLNKLASLDLVEGVSSASVLAAAAAGSITRSGAASVLGGAVSTADTVLEQGVEDQHEN